MVGHGGRLLSLHGLGELDIPTLDEPVGGGVVAVVWQKVVVELPEHVERHSAIRCEHIVVGLSVHVVKVVHGEVFRQ